VNCLYVDFPWTIEQPCNARTSHRPGRVYKPSSLRIYEQPVQFFELPWSLCAPNLKLHRIDEQPVQCSYLASPWSRCAPNVFLYMETIPRVNSGMVSIYRNTLFLRITEKKSSFKKAAFP